MDPDNHRKDHPRWARGRCGGSDRRSADHCRPRLPGADSGVVYRQGAGPGSQDPGAAPHRQARGDVGKRFLRVDIQPVPGERDEENRYWHRLGRHGHRGVRSSGAGSGHRPESGRRRQRQAPDAPSENQALRPQLGVIVLSKQFNLKKL